MIIKPKNNNPCRTYDEHRDMLEKIPDLAMTMILSETDTDDGHRYFIAHDENRKLLSFRPPESAKKAIDVEAGIFKAKIRSRVHFRMNLRDTGLCICSPTGLK